jgi:two-component sensor histidine kinase
MPEQTKRSTNTCHPSDSGVELDRLAAVRRFDILDTPPDGAFDRITALAARELRVPIAIVSIVDHDRIWFKSHHGLDVEQIGRDPGLCASCILQDGPWLVTDARRDPRTLANPLVAGDFGLQFYLGVPLRTQEGFNLGTLCVLDLAPRTPTDHDVALLADLAGIVIDELELRLSAKSASAAHHQELIRREQREERIRALMRELAHRSKNLLAVVEAIARQTASSSAHVVDYVRRLSARIRGLSDTHDLIADEDWKGARLDDLAARHMAPFLDEEDQRISYSGPAVVLNPAAAQNIGLALHELGTNALKHGALSRPGGHAHLSWQVSADQLAIAWREEGGPPSTPLIHKGFGYAVLARLAPDALQGEATLTFGPTGFSWHLRVPLDEVGMRPTRFV